MEVWMTMIDVDGSDVDEDDARNEKRGEKKALKEMNMNFGLKPLRSRFGAWSPKKSKQLKFLPQQKEERCTQGTIGQKSQNNNGFNFLVLKIIIASEIIMCPFPSKTTTRTFLFFKNYGGIREKLAEDECTVIAIAFDCEDLSACRGDKKASVGSKEDYYD
ncbi:hypothetical protein FQA39_LY13552 [Lamprigera yunnana]|nr:hypothetical protein FQA39_LY13552 [Lamprigera yunnana]